MFELTLVREGEKVPVLEGMKKFLAIVREAVSKFAGSFEPRAVLVFDEKYQLMGILTLRDIIKGLEPRFLQETGCDAVKLEGGEEMAERIFRLFLHGLAAER